MRKPFATLTLSLSLIAGVTTAHTAAQTTQSAPQKQTTTPAQTAKPVVAPAELPSVDQIFDKYVQALGGREAMSKIKSRVSRGTFELTAASISGAVEVYAKAPDKSLRITNLPGFGEIRQGFNGNVAFEQQPQSGLRELSGKELEQAKRGADFYRDINLKQQYAKMVVTGVETVSGSEAYKVEATTPEGDIEKLYFDKTSGLVVRINAAPITPQGVIPVEAYLEDYRVVDGVKIPFTLRQVTPSLGTVIIRFSEIKQNVPIEDAKFNKPAAQ